MTDHLSCQQRTRKRRAPTLLVLCLLFGLPAGSLQAAEQFDIWVRDVMTGMGISQAEIAPADPVSQRTAEARIADASGRVQVQLMTEEGASVVVHAPGYRAMQIPAQPAERDAQVTTVWLRPEKSPEVLQPESIEQTRLHGMTLLHGHVVDVTSGTPVEGAEVVIEDHGQQTFTDEQGYFQFHVQGSRPRMMEDIPEFADVVVNFKGYRSVRLQDVALIAEDFHFIVDLENGHGEKALEMRPKLFPENLEFDPGFDPSEPEVTDWADSETAETGDLEALDLEQLYATLGEATQADTLEISEDEANGRSLRAVSRGGLRVKNPPDRIYVRGYGWYPLEVYLSRGLCSEWIASWPYQSLFAGAIPYRSYASWYQINNGSICNTTSCQVFRNQYNSRCDTAAKRTTGMLLQKGGAVSRSEYSAENNGCHGCSYTAMGHPSAGWSCMSDNHHRHVTYCFGHGRGMCQWGTEAWAEGGKKWTWMVDRYYNNFGNGGGQRRQYLTTPFGMVSASTSRSSVPRGGSFSMTARVRSYADWSQPRLILGAALFGPRTLVDPPRDKKFTAYARSGYNTQSRITNASRGFRIPSNAPTGRYDLMVAAWYDVNNDGKITGVDKPLRWIRYSDAIRVY